MRLSTTFSHSFFQDHNAVAFPALFNFSITAEGSIDPVTVTFFVSKVTSNDSTPSILPKMRFTAPTQPSHIISTLSSVVFAEDMLFLALSFLLYRCCSLSLAVKYFDVTRNFETPIYDVCLTLFTRRKQNQHKKGVNVIKKNQNQHKKGCKCHQEEPYLLYLSLSGSALKKVLAWCCCDEIHQEFRRLRLIEGTDIVYPLFVFASIRDIQNTTVTRV